MICPLDCFYATTHMRRNRVQCKGAEENCNEIRSLNNTTTGRCKRSSSFATFNILYKAKRSIYRRKEKGKTYIVTSPHVSRAYVDKIDPSTQGHTLALSHIPRSQIKCGGGIFEINPPRITEHVPIKVLGNLRAISIIHRP